MNIWNINIYKYYIKYQIIENEYRIKNKKEIMWKIKVNLNSYILF